MTDMLMEFETLDREDVILIKEGKWDQEKKREKEKMFENLHRKLPPAPPSSMDRKEEESPSCIDRPFPQEG
jgi:hypothetical protein